MQKVEGSSPFSRSHESPANRRVFVFSRREKAVARPARPPGATKPCGAALANAINEVAVLQQVRDRPRGDPQYTGLVLRRACRTRRPEEAIRRTVRRPNARRGPCRF